jgi:hypothetical protein
MPEHWTAIPVFPSNGLDRSLHAPVFIGLLLLSFFKETLGWTYAGLVVPGYLATVFLSAPVTGVLVAIEALLTYAIAALLGRILPRTGAWFTFFGRERFLLIIAVASFVRLFVEASLVPAWVSYLGLGHSRELYSLGLVLVPLLANSFWNAGVVRALPRVCVVTGITYLVVSQILLRHTNFTLSRFQVANESVSLAFLETPHAHIILLIGAVLGARNNVRYGWDYNGILVPALLAVAWYQPSKIVATVVEALVVFRLSLWLLKLPILSKVLVVGSRRLAVTFAVGFVVKYCLGFLLLWFAPEVQMVDFFGFGYLLPSLMAVKFWDKQKILRVLMPTLQVSMMAFPLGIALGYALRLVSPPAHAVGSAAGALSRVESVALELMKGDAAPAPQRTGASFKQAGTYAAALALARDLRTGSYDEALDRALSMHLAVGQTAAADWIVVVPQVNDPNEDAFAPRVALRSQRVYGDSWLVVVEAEAMISATIPIAFDLAERMGAAAVVVRSRLAEVRQSDDAFIEQLGSVLQSRQMLALQADATGPRDPNAAVTLSVIGQVPSDLSPKALERRLGIRVQTESRAAAQTEKLLDRAVRLQFPVSVAEEAGAQLVGTEELGHWQLQASADLTEALRKLVGTEPDKFRAPSFGELRLYGALVSMRLEAASEAPTPWQRALAKSLGLSFATVDVVGFSGWALFEAEGPERRGAATWLQRRLEPAAAGRTLGNLIYVAAPRWEAGVLGAGTALLGANTANGLLVHGALAGAARDGTSDARRVSGRQSFFQRAYEVWVTHTGTAFGIRAMDPTEQPSTPIVATFDAEQLDVHSGPAWAVELLSGFEQLGLGIAAYDGSAERAGFGAAGDPTLAFGKRFAPDSTAVLWLRQDLRERLGQSLLAARASAGLTERFARLQLPVIAATPSLLIERREACLLDPDSEPDCASLVPTSRCTGPVLQRALEVARGFGVTQNPHRLRELASQSKDCAAVALVPNARDTAWLALAGYPAADAAREEYFFPLLREMWSAEVRRVEWADLGKVERLPLAPLQVRTE